MAAVCAGVAGCADQPAAVESESDPGAEARLDEQLRSVLARHGFTGRIQSTLEGRLGRPVDGQLADIGRLLFFDPVTSLSGDNSCSGCHAPNASFNDSKSISIGVDNNGIVGPGRRGPHNQRRAPTIINAVFYPRLMWTGRFAALSLDPFDNSQGFRFPPPDGLSLSHMEHLVGAQAFTPFVKREEMAGFDVPGDHETIRAEVLRRINAIEEYRTRFAAVFPELETGAPIAFEHIGAAIAEFTFTLVRADAPLDRFARAETNTMTADQKRGALLFFGRAMCGECHIARDYANEMFSDFQGHVLAVPQIVPREGNVRFDGPGANEDYGAEQDTGAETDRYEFRTSPLRNVAFQPTFMHNGAYLTLEQAIRHHLDLDGSLAAYTTEGLDLSLQAPVGPITAARSRAHPLLDTPIDLTEDEFRRLVDFVRCALTDPEADPERLRELVPASLPSGAAVHRFEFDRSTAQGRAGCA
ncbi:MAG: cytochrome-c peroxidase [Longimicrobiales bacterium]